MSQSVIIRRAANTPNPLEYLKLALGNCGKSWGLTYVDKGVLEIHKGKNLDIAQLEVTFNDYKDVDLTLVLSEIEANDEVLPPYAMIENDDGEPLVALIGDGNFTAFDKSGNGSAHPPIYHVAEHLSDEFFSAFEMCDKNLDKFMSAIEKDHFKKKMNMTSVSRGYLTVVAQNGKSLTFEQGDTGGELPGFPGTWVSNTFGFGKKEEPAPEPAPDKPKGMFSSMRRSTTREKHVPATNAAVAEAAKPEKTETAVATVKADTGSNNPVKPEKPKPEVLTIENITVKKEKIPGHLSRKDRRGWIRTRLGYIPPSVDNPDAVYQVYVNSRGEMLTQDTINKALGLSAAKLRADKPLKNAKPVGQPGEDISADKQVSGNPLPILSPTSREALKRFVSDERIKKLISENASLITDPENIQGHEGKIEGFAQQLGMKDMADFDALPFAELESICRQNFHAFAVMAWTWKVRALKAELAVAKKKGSVPDVQQQLAEKIEETKQEKQEQPQRRGMFSGMRKAG